MEVSKDSIPSLNRGEKSQIVITGKHSYGLHHIDIRSWEEGANLYIGSFNSIADNQVVFLGGNHRTDWATTFPFGHIHHSTFPSGSINGSGHPVTKGHVVIENDVWIGSSCTIMSGVTLGSGSVIAARSVVTKNVPPYAIVGGNPARVIKYRFSEELIAELLDLQWWNYEDQVIDSIVPLLQTPLDLSVLAKIKEMLKG